MCVLCVLVCAFFKELYNLGTCIALHRCKKTTFFFFWKGNVGEIERANEKESNNQMPILNRIVFTGIYLRYRTKLRRESVICLCVMTYRLHRHILGFYTLTPFVNIVRLEQPTIEICYRCHCEHQKSQMRNREQSKCFVSYALVNLKFILEFHFDHSEWINKDRNTWIVEYANFAL